jgi:hypothetical protein
MFGEKCILIIKELFADHRAYKKIPDKNSPEAKEIFARLLEHKEKITEVALNAPQNFKKSNALAKRFENYGNYYFTFLFNPDVDPTNNAALSELFVYPNSDYVERLMPQ